MDEEREELIKKIKNLKAEDFITFDYNYVLETESDPVNQNQVLADVREDWNDAEEKVDTFKALMLKIVNETFC
jgi:hypothetical protein